MKKYISILCFMTGFSALSGNPNYEYHDSGPHWVSNTLFNRGTNGMSTKEGVKLKGNSFLYVTSPVDSDVEYDKRLLLSFEEQKLVVSGVVDSQSWPIRYTSESSFLIEGLYDGKLLTLSELREIHNRFSPSPGSGNTDDSDEIQKEATWFYVDKNLLDDEHDGYTLFKKPRLKKNEGVVGFMRLLSEPEKEQYVAYIEQSKDTLGQTNELVSIQSRTPNFTLPWEKETEKVISSNPLGIGYTLPFAWKRNSLKDPSNQRYSVGYFSNYRYITQARISLICRSKQFDEGTEFVERLIRNENSRRKYSPDNLPMLTIDSVAYDTFDFKGGKQHVLQFSNKFVIWFELGLNEFIIDTSLDDIDRDVLTSEIKSFISSLKFPAEVSDLPKLNNDNQSSRRSNGSNQSSGRSSRPAPETEQSRGGRSSR